MALKALSGACAGSSAGSTGHLSLKFALSGTMSGASGGTGHLNLTFALSGTSIAQSGGGGQLSVITSAAPQIVELPAVYVDDASVDTTATTPALISRSPEPLEVQVPVGSDIEFDIVDVGTAGPDLSLTTITIDGVIAFQTGSFINGFVGTTTALTSPGSGGVDGQRFKITPPAVFLSLATITIRVETDLIGAGSPLDVTYTATAEDLTPPQIVTALAIAQKVVRVTYDEPVRAQGDGDPSDALTAGNYAFDALNDSVTPAVPISSESVSKFSPTEFDVTVDIEMTPNVEYELTVSSVEDLFGNPL